MSAVRAALLLVGFAAACACARQPVEKEVPALISNPTPQSRAELRRVLSTALAGAPVTIADDALTRTSVLIIERAVPRDAQGRPLNSLTGRTLQRPVRFRLVKAGNRCMLVREGSDRGWELTETTCVPK